MTYAVHCTLETRGLRKGKERSYQSSNTVDKDEISTKNDDGQVSQKQAREREREKRHGTTGLRLAISNRWTRH